MAGDYPGLPNWGYGIRVPFSDVAAMLPFGPWHKQAQEQDKLRAAQLQHEQLGNQLAKMQLGWAPVAQMSDQALEKARQALVQAQTHLSSVQAQELPKTRQAAASRAAAEEKRAGLEQQRLDLTQQSMAQAQKEYQITSLENELRYTPQFIYGVDKTGKATTSPNPRRKFLQDQIDMLMGLGQGGAPASRAGFVTPGPGASTQDNADRAALIAALQGTNPNTPQALASQGLSRAAITAALHSLLGEGGNALQSIMNFVGRAVKPGQSTSTAQQPATPIGEGAVSAADVANLLNALKQPVNGGATRSWSTPSVNDYVKALQSGLPTATTAAATPAALAQLLDLVRRSYGLPGNTTRSSQVNLSGGVTPTQQ